VFLRVLSLSFGLDVDSDSERWVALGGLLRYFRVLRVLRVVDGSKKMYGSQSWFCNMDFVL